LIDIDAQDRQDEFVLLFTGLCRRSTLRVGSSRGVVLTVRKLIFIAAVALALLALTVVLAASAITGSSGARPHHSSFSLHGQWTLRSGIQMRHLLSMIPNLLPVRASFRESRDLYIPSLAKKELGEDETAFVPPIN